MATSAVPTKLPSKGTTDPDVTMEDLSSAKENQMTGNKRPASMQVCPDPAGSATAKQIGKTGKPKAARTAMVAKEPAQKPADLLADQPKRSKAAGKRKLSSASEPSVPVDASAANGKPAAPPAKRSTKAKGKPKSESSTAQAADATAAAADEGAAPAEPAAIVGSGRQAAQGVNYREQRAQREPEECILPVKDVPAASSEADALAATAAGDSEDQAVRRCALAFVSFEDVPAASHVLPATAAPDSKGLLGRLPFEHVIAAADALATTAAAECQGPIVRRWIAVHNLVHKLTAFELADSSGEQHPIQSLDYNSIELLVSGVVHPATGSIAKDEKARRVTKIGPVKGWYLDLTGSSLQILLKTEAAQYVCMRPSNTYKKTYQHMAEQAEVAFEVHHALHPKFGGNANAELSEVIARLARAKVAKSYPNAREALLLTSNFVLGELAKVDIKAGGKAPFAFNQTGFVSSLKQEAAHSAKAALHRNPGAITIRDVSEDAEEAAAPTTAAEKQMQADADYARQMQAKLDAAQARGGGRQGRGTKQAYIKISESEIADDYPEPLQYDKVDEEIDELVLMEDDLVESAPEYLPRRLLTNFAVYNADGLFASLELLPMWSGVDPDTELYASGQVVDDDGEWAGAQSLSDAGGSSAEAGSSSSGPGASEAAGASGSSEAAGMRLYLSQIKEWIVEFSCDMLYITIRTDVAWYRMSEPLPNYAPWFSTVLKAARLAVKVIQMLSQETRASKLSFADVVKRLAVLPNTDPVFISKNIKAVERFVVVHGAIIVSQLKLFPNKVISQSAFVGSLKTAMEARRHSKLYTALKKAVRVKGVNRNPMKAPADMQDRACGSRSKPMTATATTMVKAVWQSYFNNPEGATGGEAAAADAPAAEGSSVPAAAPSAAPVAEDLNDEDDDAAEEFALAEPAAPKKRAAKAGARQQSTAWVGNSTAMADGRHMYGAVKVGEATITVGSVIEVASEDDNEATQDGVALGLLQALWQTSTGAKQMQVRSLARGAETVLGDAAADDELFLTSQLMTRPVRNIQAACNGERMQRPWSLQQRMQQYAADELRRQRNKAAAAEGRQPELFWRSLYLPEEGMFCEAPKDLHLGFCQKGPQEVQKGTSLSQDGVLTKDGTEYHVGDTVYVHPDVFDAVDGSDAVENVIPDYAAKGRFHKGGGNLGLRAYGIGKVVKFGAVANRKASKQGKAPTRVTLQRYYRPEDISRDQAYRAGFREVYSSAQEETLDVDDLIGRCTVVAAASACGQDTFFCTRNYDAEKGELEEAEDSIKGVPAAQAAAAKGKGKAAAPDAGKGKAAAPDAGKGKAAADAGKGKAAADAGKGKAAADAGKGRAAADVAASAASAEDGGRAHAVDDGIALRTMDIFAGCGGLSEGFQQAGAAICKWAVEYEHPAAEAFKLNHPEALVMCNNCNVILAAAMAKAGRQDICLASKEAEEQAAKLPADQVAGLPAPGEVEFLCGGPPCQGYSGMNRFNKGNWSMVQNSMVMSYLSFCDFYRPRYFLLENVRNFVSHNKSFTFRLTLRSLLDMGYQVRFGVLNAGNFGVSQSRKRTFIWAAAPGEHLPVWPRPLHVFRSPQLTISLPGNVKYTAVPLDVGAPLRTVTVRDVIGDLPIIGNGHDQEEMQYSGPAVSEFQQFIRGNCNVLHDHISKMMNDLNLERCRNIPKNTPGADWRCLEELVKADPEKSLFKGQSLVPWCLPNTADRHNGWRGLFGRLDWNGHFPTSTTDPQPMGKVGQVFHPEQDRIVSVRECARAQGFPDDFRFWGNVHNKHRQIGNAVPPPLAASLGRQLRKVLEVQAEQEVQAQLQAQGL